MGCTRCDLDRIYKLFEAKKAREAAAAAAKLAEEKTPVAVEAPVVEETAPVEVIAEEPVVEEAPAKKSKKRKFEFEAPIEEEIVDKDAE